MKKLIMAVMTLGTLFISHNSQTEVTISGSNDLFGYGKWLPRKAYLAF